MILAVGTDSSGYASSIAYDSGYNHGCDDAGISDPDDRYINQPEKGPPFHTGTFMRAYNDGFDACSGTNANSSSSSASSAPVKVKASQLKPEPERIFYRTWLCSKNLNQIGLQ